MTVAKEGLVAILCAIWIAGLVQQLGSWPTTIGYVAISLLMAGIVFGNRLTLRPAPRRNRRP